MLLPARRALLRASAAAAVAGGPATVWDPTNAGTGMIISGGGLTASEGGGVLEYVLATTGRTAGKLGWSFTAPNPGGHWLLVGFGARGENLETLPGNTPNSSGWSSNGGAIYFDMADTGLGPALWPAAAAAHTIQADLGARKGWVKDASGLWNGSALADPETGVGGFPLGAGMLYPIAGGQSDGSGQIVAEFVAPVGLTASYSAWG